MERLLHDGTTPGWVELSRSEEGVFILNMCAKKNPENRWVFQFSKAMHKAFEAVERHLAEDPESPAALLSVSDSPKFFSNGIDPDGKYSARLGLEALSAADRAEESVLPMPGFVRPLLLPIPTVAAINGHAFGAGMMYAIGHDYRLQREDRGYMCAIEIEIGVGIPPPEMELFKHIMPLPAFYETTMAAKRWSASDALRCGLITKASPLADLRADALKFATQQAKLAAGARKRANFRCIKNKAKGHVGRGVMEYVFPDGKFPPHLAANAEASKRVTENYPRLLSHINEVFEEVPVVPSPTKGKL